MGKYKSKTEQKINESKFFHVRIEFGEFPQQISDVVVPPKDCFVII